jgi:hypothetical protein
MPGRIAGVSGSSGLVRDPLAAIAVPLAPIVLEGRYRLLVRSLWRLGRSRRGRWALTAGSGALVISLALAAARHFATTAWPLSGGAPGILVAAGLLLLLAHGLKAYGWGRLFASGERPPTLALAAGNGAAALIGVVLPGRFDDAVRIAVVRRYPGCPAGVRVLCLSLVMLGLIDRVALAPLRRLPGAEGERFGTSYRSPAFACSTRRARPGLGKRLNRHGSNALGCSNWPCNQLPAGARNPPTRAAREARSSRRTDLRCGASLLLDVVALRNGRPFRAL